MKPTIGRIVLVTLTAELATNINQSRADIVTVEEGETYPLIITRVHEPDTFTDEGTINGKLFLDGPDDYWLAHIKSGKKYGQWRWPEREPAPASTSDLGGPASALNRVFSQLLAKDGGWGMWLNYVEKLRRLLNAFPLEFMPMLMVELEESLRERGWDLMRRGKAIQGITAELVCERRGLYDTEGLAEAMHDAHQVIMKTDVSGGRATGKDFSQPIQMWKGKVNNVEHFAECQAWRSIASTVTRSLP